MFHSVTGVRRSVPLEDTVLETLSDTICHLTSWALSKLQPTLLSVLLSGSNETSVRVSEMTTSEGEQLSVRVARLSHSCPCRRPCCPRNTSAAQWSSATLVLNHLLNSLASLLKICETLVRSLFCEHFWCDATGADRTALLLTEQEGNLEICSVYNLWGWRSAGALSMHTSETVFLTLSPRF